MGSLTLFTAPQLSVLIKSLAERLTQNSSSDLLELSTVVFPNQHLKDVITWHLTSELNQDTGDELREGCLTGVRKMFTSELFESLSEAFNLPSLPSSEELAWALLSRAQSPSQEAPSQEVSAARFADAQRCSELLFRLPFSAPSSLQEEVSFTLPASLSKDSSSQEQLSLKALWRELLEQREAQSVNDNTAGNIEGFISTPTESSEEPSQPRARLSRQLGQLHLIAPKALNVSLLRLLKRASRHININLYLLSAPHEPQTLAHQAAFADTEAFKLNFEAIQRYCAPDQTYISSVNPSDTVKVALHHCHYDARQVEALNERLKQLFDADPTLTQRDVLVLVSDLKRFLPFIEQQFTVGHYSRDRLSAVIVDRGLDEDNPYETLLFSLCSLPTKRVSLELIIDLFSLTPVQERFPVSEGRLEQLRSMLERLQLRWGLDEFDQERLTGVASPLHTWRMAIERLMISELMDPIDQPESPYLDLTLPASPLGEADYQALSTFLTFFTTLEQLLISHPSVSPSHTKAPDAQPYHVWRAWLLNALDQLTVPYHGDKTEGLRDFMVREVIHRVERELLHGARNSAELKLTTSAVMGALSAGLKSYRSVRGRSGIGVTFAPLSVGAGAPARVLAFLGMEEGTVPQKTLLSPLDPLNPRHPDRLAVNDQTSGAEWLREVSYSPSHASSEWASFLSACENTSDELMVFWNATPRFSHDEPIEPCSPVRYLMKRYQEHLTVQERVSPYDPWYFSAQCTQRPLNKLAYEAAQVISHTINSAQETAHKSADAAAETTAQKKQRAPYIARRSTAERVSLSELSKSITNPQELFFQKAGYQLIAPKENSSTSIPLESNALLSWQVRTDLVKGMMSSWQSLRASGKEGAALEGEFEATLAPIYQKHYLQLRAQAKLPPGALGRSLYQDMWRQALQYFYQLKKIMIAYQPTPVFNSHLDLDFSKDHNTKITLPLTIYESLENPGEFTVIEYTQSKIEKDSAKITPLWLQSLFLDYFHQRGLHNPQNQTYVDTEKVSFLLVGLYDGKANTDISHSPCSSDMFNNLQLLERRFSSLEAQRHEKSFQMLPIENYTDIFTHRENVLNGDKDALIWDFSLLKKMQRGKLLKDVISDNRDSFYAYEKNGQLHLDNQCQHIYMDSDIYLKIDQGSYTSHSESFNKSKALFEYLHFTRQHEQED